MLERYQRWLYHYRKKDGEPLTWPASAASSCRCGASSGGSRRPAEIPANPAADMELPRAIRRLPRVVLTVAEAERVLASADRARQSACATAP